MKKFLGLLLTINAVLMIIVGTDFLRPRVVPIVPPSPPSLVVAEEGTTATWAGTEQADTSGSDGGFAPPVDVAVDGSFAVGAETETSDSLKSEVEEPQQRPITTVRAVAGSEPAKAPQRDYSSDGTGTRCDTADQAVAQRIGGFDHWRGFRFLVGFRCRCGRSPGDGTMGGTTFRQIADGVARRRGTSVAQRVGVDSGPDCRCGCLRGRNSSAFEESVHRGRRRA